MAIYEAVFPLPTQLLVIFASWLKNTSLRRLRQVLRFMKFLVYLYNCFNRVIFERMKIMYKWAYNFLLKGNQVLLYRVQCCLVLLE